MLGERRTKVDFFTHVSTPASSGGLEDGAGTSTVAAATLNPRSSSSPLIKSLQDLFAAPESTVYVCFRPAYLDDAEDLSARRGASATFYSAVQDLFAFTESWRPHLVGNLSANSGQVDDAGGGQLQPHGGGLAGLARRGGNKSGGGVAKSYAFPLGCLYAAAEQLVDRDGSKKAEFCEKFAKAVGQSSNEEDNALLVGGQSTSPSFPVLIPVLQKYLRKQSTDIFTRDTVLLSTAIFFLLSTTEHRSKPLNLKTAEAFESMLDSVPKLFSKILELGEGGLLRGQLLDRTPVNAMFGWHSVKYLRDRRCPTGRLTTNDKNQLVVCTGTAKGSGPLINLLDPITGIEQTFDVEKVADFVEHVLSPTTSPLSRKRQCIVQSSRQ